MADDVKETPLMRQARLAAERVAGWSRSKQDYARRAIAAGGHEQSPQHEAK
jgi:hypothetical protein